MTNINCDRDNLDKEVRLLLAQRNIYCNSTKWLYAKLTTLHHSSEISKEQHRKLLPFLKFKREKVGDVPTEMFFHFFKSFSDAGKCNLNIKAEGENEHHKIEAIFKAFAKAIKMAVKRDLSNMQLPSTKGVL